jgi:hypothetical protein
LSVLFDLANGGGDGAGALIGGGMGGVLEVTVEAIERRGFGERRQVGIGLGEARDGNGFVDDGANGVRIAAIGGGARRCARCARPRFDGWRCWRSGSEKRPRR